MTYLKKEIKYLKQILTREEIKYYNFHKKRYLDILQSIHINKNVKILDLGCSNGHLLLILKKNGKLIISTPNACELGKRLLFLLGKNIYWDINTFYERGIYERHNREFSMDELKFILKINGFSKFKSKYLSSWEGLRQIEKNNPLATIISMIQKLFPKFRSNLLI